MDGRALDIENDVINTNDRESILTFSKNCFILSSFIIYVKSKELDITVEIKDFFHLVPITLLAKRSFPIIHCFPKIGKQLLYKFNIKSRTIRLGEASMVSYFYRF